MIGHWTPAQLGRIWVVGLLAEALLVLLPFTAALLTAPHPQTDAERGLQEMKARMDSVDRGLRPPLPTMSDSQRAMLKSYFEDTLGFRLVKRGDTTKVIATTPRARAIEAHVARALHAVGTVLITGLTILAIVYLPIPIALLGITALWLWQRRRFNSEMRLATEPGDQTVQTSSRGHDTNDPG